MTDQVVGTKSFVEVFRAELDDIRIRRGATSRTKLSRFKTVASVKHGLTGLALSGGGVRSASFSLGVLQALASKSVIRHIDYLSTVSGGGYIGTAMTIGMSTTQGTFPFARIGIGTGESPETKHIRDNSRYLVSNGLPSVISALAIYMRGIVMNILILLPLILLASAALIALVPDTTSLTTSPALFGKASREVLGASQLPNTVIGGIIIFLLWVLYSTVVSIFPIQKLRVRQSLAKVAAGIILIFGLIVIFEVHWLLLKLLFEQLKYVPGRVAGPVTDEGNQVFKAFFQYARTFILWIGPLVILILPYIKTLAEKATADKNNTWLDFAKKILSRVLLIFAAAIVPAALWLFMMQLAFWGIAIPPCPPLTVGLICPEDQFHASWPQAPVILQRIFTHAVSLNGEFKWIGAAVVYALGAIAVILILWPFLSVNSNSLHQLYRDRLGSAFLFKRKDPSNPANEELVTADDFEFEAINPKFAPYHLINTALNVPGSEFANRRGRNADFFIFSRRYIGSEATGFIETKLARKVVDRLNVGTAMAISGAAVAPNMGMASVKPLSPTIAFLNVRLGRWLRHPHDIANRIAALKTKTEGESAFWRIPGPRYLLREAFSKTGLRLGRPGKKADRKEGFVFLSDGGHIENLGVYELLRRRCRLIIAVDGEADPDMECKSLVQLERFALIDMGIRINMNWQPIAARTRAVGGEAKQKSIKSVAGPHIALGLIDYPPVPNSGSPREKGVLIYVKASLSGDENDYVLAYKTAHESFPHETTADQLFSEEQLEVYRALGEHAVKRFLEGKDKAAVFKSDRNALLGIIKATIPGVSPK